MYYFCTYFDKNYCDKGLALFESLNTHVKSFTLFVLCLDNDTYELFLHLNLSSVILIRLNEIESRNPDFLATKKNRSIIEYYFTCTSVFILDTLLNNSEIDILTYLDSDMYFFSSIDEIYKLMKNYSILIFEHRFSPHLQSLMIYGRFNVGYLSFRNDEEGIQCLNVWRKECIKWCYDRIEGEKFADQKYLDNWEDLYPKLIIPNNIGFNLAPWNVSQYPIMIGKNKQIKVNGEQLLIYHFHGVKGQLNYGFFKSFDIHMKDYLGPNYNDIINLRIMYYQYILHLLKCRKRLSQHYKKEYKGGYIRVDAPQISKNDYPIFNDIFKVLKQMIYEKNYIDILYIITILGKYYEIPFYRIFKKL